jgi:hypothetical protein
MAESGHRIQNSLKGVHHRGTESTEKMKIEISRVKETKKEIRIFAKN